MISVLLTLTVMTPSSEIIGILERAEHDDLLKMCPTYAYLYEELEKTWYVILLLFFENQSHYETAH